MTKNLEQLKPILQFLAKYTAMKIDSKWKYDPTMVFAVSKIDLLPFQLIDYLEMIKMYELHEEIGSAGVRFLLAYETGLGKTILAGLFLKDLIIKNNNARVLVVCPRPAILQWQKEMQDKFDLNFSIYDNLNDLKEKLLIASIDKLKRKKEKIDYRDTKWDLVIVDELHRATSKGDNDKGNQRYELIKLLSSRTTHFLGLTATPHDGKRDHFISRLKLIFPSLTEDNLEGYLKKYMIRRRKKDDDVTDINGNPLFPYDVIVKTIKINVTKEELEFYRGVENYVKNMYGMAENYNSPRGLVATIMGRLVSSSCYTGINAMERRKKRIAEKTIKSLNLKELWNKLNDNELMGEEIDKIIDELLSIIPEAEGYNLQEEIEELDRLINLGKAINVDSKLEKLKETIKNIEDKKIVIFSSFIDTAEYLYRELSKIYPGGTYLATGKLDKNQLQTEIKDFREKGKILIGTDVLNESLNLQVANVVINYELPYNPIVYIQRVGRVFRYPMRDNILVQNFSSVLNVEERALEIIYNKVNQMVKDFDEGSVEIIGNVITENETIRAIFEEYKGKNGLKIINEDFNNAFLSIDEVKRTLSISESAKRHVNISNILENPNEMIFKENLMQLINILKFLGYAGFTPDGLIGYVKGINIERLSVEDRAVQKAIEIGKNFSPQKICVIDDELKDGIILEVGFYDNNGNKVDSRIVYFDGEKFSDPQYIIELFGDEDIRNKIFPCKDVNFNVDNDKLNKILLSDEYIKNERNKILNRVLEYSNYILEFIDELKKEKSEGLNILNNIPNTILDQRRKSLPQEVFPKIETIIGMIEVKKISEVENYSGIGYNPEEVYEHEKHKKEIENKAMEIVINKLKEDRWEVEDVHEDNLGYDLKAIKDGKLRYIEVKGLSDANSESFIMTLNEYKASKFYKENYYVYLVLDPLNNPIIKELSPPFEAQEKLITQYEIKIK